MALNDLIKQAQQSRLGKAIGSLGNRFDADKATQGFQFRTPQQRQVATQRQQQITTPIQNAYSSATNYIKSNLNDFTQNAQYARSQGMGYTPARNLDTLIPQLPKFAERVGQGVGHVVASVPGLNNPRFRNPIVNTIGGFAKGYVETPQEVYSIEQKVKNKQPLTQQEKRYWQEDSMQFVGGLLGGIEARGFKPGSGEFSSLLDKKVRFEIDDSRARLILPKGKFSTKLGNVLGHDELFKNYPEFAEMPIISGKLGGAQGQFTGKAIFLDEDFLAHPTAYDKIKIQRADGTVASYVPSKDKVKSTLLHEIQHAIQTKEGFARGGSVERQTPEQLQKVTQEFKSLVAQYNQKPTPELENKLRELYPLIEDPYNQYRKLAGELEAGAVQRRMNLTPEQRASSDPYAAEALARAGTTNPDDFITRFDGGNQASVEAKEISGKQVSDYWSKELGVRPGDEDMLKLAEESGPYRLIDIKVKDIIEKDQNLAKEIANNKSMTNKLTSDSSGKAVIIDKDGVLDGYHRIAQTYKANPEATIKAYVSTRSSFTNSPTKGVEPTKTFTFHSDSFSTQKIKTSKGTAVVKTIPSKQLKDQAQQALQNPAVQQSVRQADETLKTKVNLIDYMRTPEKVLQKIGLGKQASEIRRAYLNYSLELPKEIDRITQWYERAGANPEASKRIFKHMDGQGVMLSPQEQAVADEMKQYLKQWADRLGIPEDKRITNYITHLFEEDFIKKEFDPEIEKIIRNQIPGSVYDPFLQKRYGIAGYKEDAFAALDAYVKRATRKVHMDPALESLKKASQDLPDQSWQYVKKYADNVNLRPSDTDNLLDTAIKQSPLGYKLGQRPIANISRNLRTMVYRGTLGLNVGSAIRNLTQGANTYAELGERWTAKGYFDVTRDILSRSKELEEVGVLSGSLVQDRSLSATKKAGQKLDSVLFSLFEIAEKINRGAAYYGAKARALSKGKSQEEAIQEGIDIARKTQFTFGSVDTPVAMQGDIAKMFSQFQSFNVKQAEFLLDKAAKKEYAGLLRYIGAWMVFAAAGKEVLGLDWKSAIPFSNVAEGESPVAQTPPFQLTSGILRAGIQGKDQYGGQLEGNPLQRIASDSEVQKAAGAMVIPAFTQGKKTLEGIMAFNRGYSETSSGRMRYPIEKTQGNQIKTGIFGQYSTKEAREYFVENKTPLGEQQTEIYKSLPADQGKEYLNMVEQERELNRIFDKLENEEIDEKEAESLIQKVGASEGYSPLIDSKNKMLQEKMVSFTKKKVNAGLAVSEEELQAAYLDKSAQMPKSNRFEKSKRDSALYSSYSTIQSNEDLSDAQKQVLSTKIATELGKTPEDLQRYSIAKEDNDTKTMHALDQYEQSKSIDDFLRFLANGRTPINGHIMVSDGVIDNLVEEGIIPEALGKDFKSLDLNEDGTIKKGKIKGKSGKSAAKARAKAVNDAFEDLKRISIQSPKIRATSGSGTGRINTKALTFSGA